MTKTTQEKVSDVKLIDTGENVDKNTPPDDDQGWIRHEPGTRSRTKHTRATSTNDDRTDISNDRFEIASLRTFDKFHGRMYHVIHSIVHKSQNQGNKFCIEWIKAEKHPSHVFDEKATFRTIQKLFKIKNLQEYREFLLNCPEISNYVTTRNRDTDGISFEFDYFFHQPKRPVPIKPVASDTTTTVKDSNVANPTYAEAVMLAEDSKPAAKPNLDVNTAVDSEGYISCVGNKDDFGALMNKVWLIMSSYAVAMPHDDASTLWTKWVDQGLTSNSTFQDVKRITAMPGLDEFYFYLSDCPPVTTVLDIKWDHKILYWVAPLTSPITSSPTSELTDDSDATIFQEPEKWG